MARHVNASPDGVAVLDVDPNALTRTRIIDNAAGDTALVYDLVTGKNSPPAVLDHSGPGNGCVLGLPIVNQACDAYRSIFDEDSSFNADVSIWQVVAVQPAGEDSASMVVDFSAFPSGVSEFMQFEVLTMAYASVGIAPILSNGFAATITGLTPGTVYFYRVRHRLLFLAGIADALNFNLGFFRREHSNTIVRTPSDVRDSTEVFSQTVSSAIVIDQHDFDAAEVTTEAMAISGYHATKLAHNQHALEEFITGAPAGTNQTRVLTPSGTQGAYYDHSRLGSEFSAMPLIKRFPVGGGSLGYAPLDGGTAEDGVGGWNEPTMTACPGWKDPGTAYLSLIYHDCWMPRHAANNLSFIVLGYSPDGSFSGLVSGNYAYGQLQVYNSISAGLVATAASNTWTQIGSSKWWYWAVSGVDHSPEISNLLVWSMKFTGGTPKTDGAGLRIAGWSSSLEG